jgi:hypothetical protein
MRFRNTVLFLAVALFCPCIFAQQYSQGPRSKGEEVLDELLIGKKTLLVKVGSGGCTSKSSYRIDTQKVEGITPLVPHYILTINRTQIDECKAIVDDGPVILWDFEKDLGLKGNFTISVRNMVYVVPPPYDTEDTGNSMLSAVKKHVDIEGAERKEEAPKEEKGRKKL